MMRGMKGKSMQSTIDWSTSKLIEVAGQYKSVLDVGCGDGRILKQVRSPVRHGIDACQKAIDVANADGNQKLGLFQGVPVYDVDFQCFDLNTVLIGLRLLPEVECVYGLDIIEHFEHKAAIDLLQKCEEAASKCLMWFIPVGNHPQSKDDRGFDNDYFQTHRSKWYPEDMEELGYRVFFYPHWHKNIKPPKEKGAMWCLKELG